MTRHIALSERQQEIAEALIDSGRLVADRRPTEEERFATLRAAIQVGIDDLEQGRFVEFATGEELEAHLDDLLAEVVACKGSE